MSDTDALSEFAQARIGQLQNYLIMKTTSGKETFHMVRVQIVIVQNGQIIAWEKSENKSY